MRSEYGRIERGVGDREDTGGGVTDLSALAASAAPCMALERDGSSGRVDLGPLVRAIGAHQADPPAPAAGPRQAPSGAPSGAPSTPPVALPIAPGRADGGRHSFARGVALGGFAAAAIALTPLLATITFEPPPVTITLLDPAPARGRVEHATVAAERDEPAAVPGTAESVATPDEPTRLDLGDDVPTDDDPIAGLDPSDPIERLDPIEPAERVERIEVIGSERREQREVAVIQAAVAPARAGTAAHAATPPSPAAAPSALGGSEPPAPAAMPEAATAPTAAPVLAAAPGAPAESAPEPEPGDALAEAATTSAPPEAVVASGPASIDQLLEGAVEREEPAPASAAPAPEAALPATPSRDDVDRALEPVLGAVRACAQAAHGVASVRITVAGSSGRVTSALVEGELAGTPTGSCVARAVRGAEFRRFERATFTVQYPFRI